MLKTELHTHIKADPQDGKLIKYSAFELIDRAAELNFQVLAITCHDFVYENEEAREYARKKGILLLAGMEKTLQGKHTLLYNLSNEEAQQIKTFTELRYYKKAHPEVLVIAPHPFHWQWTCLKDKIVEDLELFDLWEINFFHTKRINPNLKTKRLAERHHKHLVGCSDVHDLADLGHCYTLVDAPLHEESFWQALREGKTKVVEKALSTREFMQIIFRLMLSPLRRLLP